MANFKFNIINGAQVTWMPELLEVVRPCYVSGLTLINSPVSDPRALTRILSDPNCPQRYSPDPDPLLAGKGCVLRGYRNLRAAGNDPSKAIMDIVWRGPPTSGDGGSGTNVWTLTQSSHMSVVHTNMTCLPNRKPIQVVYVKNGGAPPAPPWNGNVCASVVAFHPSGGMRVTGLLTAAQWLPLAQKISHLRGHINSQQWGTNTHYSRGTWLFEGPITKTQDFGVTFFVELNFLHRNGGFWGLGTYIEKTTGYPPSDITSEALLRSLGLPAVGDIRQGNGITLASVQPEADFNTFFDFTPV